MADVKWARSGDRLLRTRVTRRLRTLDFDIENRPLSYWIPDRPSAQVTAIAWSFIGERKVECYLLEPPGEGGDPDADWQSTYTMLEAFRAAYDSADVVTGHYIRRHDLPILNGAYAEAGLLPLEGKLASDTKLDLIGWKDLPQSQEYLSDMYGLTRPKHHMSQHEWRESNRLTAIGREYTRKRVVKDVQQHKQLRAHLIEAGVLAAPQFWEP